MKVNAYNKGHFTGITTGSLKFKSGANLAMHIDDASLTEFNKQVYGIIESAGENGHKFVDSAVHAILNNSRQYVPIDTGTLTESGYARTTSVVGIGTNERRVTFFQGEVGYGDDNAASFSSRTGEIFENGAVNPDSGLPPSQYAWKVHEDLTANHPNGGQAKFLERAFREYVFDQLPGEAVELERTVYNRKDYKPKFKYTANAKIFLGRKPIKKAVREKDSKSNYERVSDLYKAKGR